MIIWLVAHELTRANLDDYDIIAPQELIDDVLDDNFTDWVGIRNRIDLDNALADADFYDFENK